MTPTRFGSGVGTGGQPTKKTVKQEPSSSEPQQAQPKSLPSAAKSPNQHEQSDETRDGWKGLIPRQQAIWKSIGGWASWAVPCKPWSNKRNTLRLAKLIGLSSINFSLFALDTALRTAALAWRSQVYLPDEIQGAGLEPKASAIEATMVRAANNLHRSVNELAKIPSDFRIDIDLELSERGHDCGYDGVVFILLDALSAAANSGKLAELKEDEASPGFHARGGRQGGHGPGAPALRLIHELHVCWWRLNGRPRKIVNGVEVADIPAGVHWDNERREPEITPCGVLVKFACDLITQGHFFPSTAQIKKHAPSLEDKAKCLKMLTSPELL